MFSRTSTDCGRVALAAHDTADVLRLHEKKYKKNFGVGNVLPGDGTLFVSSTKYSKAGSAWTSLLSSDAAKDPDNGEASPTKHFTFSDLVVDANDAKAHKASLASRRAVFQQQRAAAKLIASESRAAARIQAQLAGLSLIHI